MRPDYEGRGGRRNRLLAQSSLDRSAGCRRNSGMRRLLALFCSLFLVAPLAAQEVDAELLPVVDVSRSMSPTELDLQRRGHAEALRSAPVAEQVWPTQATPYDCLIGERFWSQRNRNFGVN